MDSMSRTLHSKALAPGVPDGTRHSFRFVTNEVEDRDLHAPSSEGSGHAPAQVATSAGDDRDLAPEIEEIRCLSISHAVPLP
jgi:hypothetical protein